MLDDKSLGIMRELMEAFGPSGFEREVNQIVKRHMEGGADEVLTDKLGTVAFRLDGDGPTVLLTGHTDEVGFIVSSVSDEGYLTFNQLGGWWDQVLLAQRVVVRGRKGDVHGVIASKPPHILPQDEPSKAFDDRMGAFVFMEAMKRIKEQGIAHPNVIVGAATVQEEVGLRGAQTIAHAVEPDVSIVLEGDIAGDVPGIKPSEALTKMGKGPGLITYDGSMIPNQPFKEFVVETARQAQIPLQLSQISGGGTPAGERKH